MNKIIINDVIVNKNQLEFIYSIKGEWSKYFKLEESFIIEYSKNIDNVPPNVAIVPLLCNILPIAWVFDAEIIINEIDKDFYEGIEDFKQGYKDMYPMLDFRGKINCKKLIENRQEGSDNCATFFSGGVDAYQTLISHIDERPDLITVWGADITFEDEKGWNLVNKHITKIADENDLEYVSIKSSFRRVINDEELDKYLSQTMKESWWHGFQHGIGLLGHVAPYAYQYKIKTVYFASSFTAADKGKITCASDPSIDNFVKFSDCHVIHDGYDFSRQDKIHRICEYVKKTRKNIQLRVCWISNGGSNCCHCEKCYRTILGIIAEKENPSEYGFNYSDDDFTEMMFDMRTRINVKFKFRRYKCIQKALHNNYTLSQVDKRLNWFYKMDFEQTRYNLCETFYRIVGKLIKYKTHFLKNL